MIPSFDAWAIRRLVCGHELNGELQSVSGPFRPLAERMAARPAGSRQATLDGFLSGRPDAEGIIRALADADPSGPAPGHDPDEPADDWPPPRLGSLPRVEPFPIAVLPEPAARLVVEGAGAIGCSPDFIAVPALAVAAGAIGRSASLMLKPGYFASATVYAASIGPPSDGKTPGQKVAAAAIRRIDEALEAEYEAALERWKEEVAEGGQDGKKQKPPPRPRPQRIDIDDITMEAIPVLLQDNPRGLIMVRDELTAFVLGMNQFKGGKGNDRSNALKIWSGDSIKKDRVNHEDNVPVRCAHPALTIVGGLTPDMLGELLDPKGRADGFLDRFLLAYPDAKPVADWTDRGIPEDVSDDWCGLVARLWQRSLNVKDGRAVPHVAHFSPDGKAGWSDHYNAHAAEMNASDFPPSLRGPWGKFREYAGRLSLILALMDHAAGPTADPGAVPNVEGRHVRDAWTLVDYFKSHAKRVHAAIAQGRGIGGGPVVEAIVGWFREGHRSSFSERDLKQARRWIEPADLADALAFLTDRAAIRPRPMHSDRPKGGRPPSPVHDVNPALLDSQNPRIAQNPCPSGGEDRPFEGFEGSAF